MENFEQYLKPSELYDFDKKNVKEKALEITKDLKTDEKKAIALLYYVCNYFYHEMITPFLSFLTGLIFL